MSENNVVTVKNLFTNPKPASTSGFIAGRSADHMRMEYVKNSATDAYIQLTAISNLGDKYCYYDIGVLPAGSYVYAAYIVCGEQSLNVMRVITVDSNNVERELGGALYNKGQAVYTVPFSFGTPTRIRLRIQAPRTSGLTANYRRLIVCTAEDYREVVQLYERDVLQFPWFDGDTLGLR